MKVASLFSGGKDSMFSLYWAVQQGWDVRCLVTLCPMNKDSWMFHTPNISWTRVQAEALGIPHILHKTSGEKEDELADLRDALQQAKQEYHLQGLVVGAILSDYQQERVNRICEEVGLKTFAPLWHKDQKLLLREMIDCGFDIIIQSIAADGLSKKWLGRRIDHAAYHDLVALQQKIGFHPAGEGGEFESFVLDCPLFNKRILVQESYPVMESEHTGVLVFTKLSNEQKK
ncbi:diphthine--ammonia ligase [Candidatus Woesearchaeota archaeon]|nr:diphthine--ammonia ligase [Candidatus Woesearchaeota archaeon]